MNLIRDFFGTIATTKLWGNIPLDVVLHFVLGALLFWILTKLLRKSIMASLLILLLIAISKELFDLGVVLRNYFYLEPFKDILITMVGALLLTNMPKNSKRIS
jgi:hypothetical protein